MGKTITIRVDDETYEKIRSAADSEKRSISNFMEYATLNYLESSSFVSEEEMQTVLQDSKLLHSLKESLDDIQEGRYRIVG
jgi:predicted transcriptional regulator